MCRLIRITALILLAGMVFVPLGAAMAQDNYTAVFPNATSSIGDIVDIPDEPVPILSDPGAAAQIEMWEQSPPAVDSDEPFSVFSPPSTQKKPGASAIDGLIDEAKSFTIDEDIDISDDKAPTAALPSEREVASGFGLYAILAAAGVLIIGLCVFFTKRVR